MLLFAALLQAQAPSLQVSRIVRITDAPGMRDNAIAVAGSRGTVVLWEQSPGIDREGATRPPVQIWRARLRGSSVGRPESFVAGHGNQWWPAVVTTDRGGMLAYYAADADRRTGDRDILLQDLDRDFRSKGSGRRVTENRHSTLPLNDATPAMARLGNGRTIVVWSRGAFDERTGKYVDKDLVLAEVRRDGKPGGELQVTTSKEVGHEMAPALASLPDGRMLVVYVSDSAAGSRPALYSRSLEATFRVGPAHRLTSADRGVTRPSLARAGSQLWISWYDLEANDVMIARVVSDSSLSSATSLRELLLKSEFRKYGAPHAGLSGASLFVDRGKLGVAFVGTMAFEPSAARVQRDVFLAWF